MATRTWNGSAWDTLPVDGDTIAVTSIAALPTGANLPGPGTYGFSIATMFDGLRIADFLVGPGRLLGAIVATTSQFDDSYPALEVSQSFTTASIAGQPLGIDGTCTSSGGVSMSGDSDECALWFSAGTVFSGDVTLTSPSGAYLSEDSDDKSFVMVGNITTAGAGTFTIDLGTFTGTITPSATGTTAVIVYHAFTGHIAAGAGTMRILALPGSNVTLNATGVVTLEVGSNQAALRITAGTTTLGGDSTAGTVHVGPGATLDAAGFTITPTYPVTGWGTLKNALGTFHCVPGMIDGGGNAGTITFDPWPTVMAPHGLGLGLQVGA